MERRRMCPNCRAFIDIGDRVCPYCEVQLGPRVVDQRARAEASFLPRVTTASAIVLTINCLLFLAEILKSRAQGAPLGTVTADLGMKFLPYILMGQWWRLITAGFLHGGFIHLAMNSYALLILVTEVEQFYGTARFTVVYVFSSVCGFLLSCIVSPNTLSLGASASAFGLIGVMLAMGFRKRRDPLAHLVRQHYGRYAIFGIAMSFFGNIDLAAHLGGLAGGFVFGFVAGLPGLPSTPRERFWQTAAILTVCVVIYAFFSDWRAGFFLR